MIVNFLSLSKGPISNDAQIVSIGLKKSKVVHQYDVNVGFSSVMVVAAQNALMVSVIKKNDIIHWLIINKSILE